MSGNHLRVSSFSPKGYPLSQDISQRQPVYRTMPLQQVFCVSWMPAGIDLVTCPSVKCYQRRTDRLRCRTMEQLATEDERPERFGVCHLLFFSASLSKGRKED
eukprot:Lithocolla_globosa_v1_NODE_3548_length_1641_cov_3.305801.p3 type:complete len:103 gc:universal NODE_3548_length_1641_cov_3.305801:1468-1160(-)